jgi:hypothetical protein
LTEGSDARFIVRRPHAGETRVASVEELHEKVREGKVFPDDELFDAGTGQWASARDVPVYRFIVDELELDGALPAGLLEALESPPPPSTPVELSEDVDPSSDALEPTDSPEVEGFRTSGIGEVEREPRGSEGDQDATDDPLGLDLDLVDEPEFPVPEPPMGSSESSDTPDESSGLEDGPPLPTSSPGKSTPDPPREGIGAPDGSGADDDEPVEDDDFAFEFGSDAIHGWGREWGDVGSGEGEEDEGEKKAAGSKGPAHRDRPSGSSREKDDEQEWFTPHEEGGLAMEPAAASPAGEDEDAPAVWTPDDGEPPPSSQIPPQFRVRRSFMGIVVLATVVVVGLGWLFLRSGEPREQDEVMLASDVQVDGPPELPPPPPELEAGLAPGLAGIRQHFAIVIDSLQDELGLESAPPRSWLSGQYLADAQAFPEVPEFWNRYIDFVEVLAPRDRELYLEGARMGLEDGLDGLPDESGGQELDTIEAYFQQRYEQQADFREFRYANLQAAARASLALHEVLSQHGEVITYSPAVGGGVSVDPILEASIPAGPVRREVDQALDRVFRALDRSRGGGIPSTDGLNSELFLRFGEG